MQEITVKAPAKLNLALDIVGTDGRGYHLMKMVMQTIGLYDTITVQKQPEGTSGEEIILSCTHPAVPCNEHNIAYAVAHSFFDTCGIRDQSLRIHIQKLIPQQAGMAGGSANGAGVLAALNALYQTKLSLEELCRIGKETGADIPFCLTGGTALVEGIGEKITKLPDLPDCVFVVAKPKGGISTQRAFAEFDRRGIAPSLDLEKMCKAIGEGDILSVSENLYNAFERVCGLRDVEIINNMMMSCGAKGALMTGSGSAVFGIFTDRGRAYACEKRLKERYAECFLCNPVPHGPVIV